MRWFGVPFFGAKKKLIENLGIEMQQNEQIFIRPD